MCVTDKEFAINDSYLIEQGEKHEIITYRKNLLKKVQEIYPEDFSQYTYDSIKDQRTFRELLSHAEEKGISVYQLTRL